MPAGGASLPAYAALAYHLPLSIVFSLRRRAPFVWGGCMMLRARELAAHHGGRGALRAWRDGGYSDDLLLAALCARERLPVATHRAALLPQLLPRRFGWGAYWNYLRRQIYVLDTYDTDHCRRLNHGLLAAHTWASTCVGLALPSAAAQLACLAAPRAGAAAALAGRAAALKLAALAAAAASSGGQGAAASAAAAGVLTALGAVAERASAAGAALAAVGSCPASVVAPWGGPRWWQPAALSLFVGVMCAAQCALAWMGSQSVAMMAALSEEGGSGGVGGSSGSGAKRSKASSSSGSAAVLAQAAPMCWARAWLGILVESFVLPACVALTLLRDEIEWAGIAYRKRRGRVTVVSRPPLVKEQP